MPLENTPGRNPGSIEARSSRRTLLVSFAAGSILLVTGCASGTSREAERGRDRDAERTSVVDDMQRTATSRLINGTPEATPGPDDE